MFDGLFKYPDRDVWNRISSPSNPNNVEVVASLLHFALKHISSKCVSLHKDITSPGYNLRDIERLIERIFCIRRIDDGLFSEDSNSVEGGLSMGMLALSYLKSCILFDCYKDTRSSCDSITVNFHCDATSILELRQVRGCSFDEAPLYINGNSLQVAILSWRMEIGK